jgi:proliferating cell nuclear antigen
MEFEEDNVPQNRTKRATPESNLDGAPANTAPAVASPKRTRKPKASVPATPASIAAMTAAAVTATAASGFGSSDSVVVAVSTVDFWVKICTAYKNFRDAMDFEFTEKGISVDCLETSNVCFTKIRLPLDVFLEYRIKRPEVVRIRLSALDSILKMASASTSVIVIEMERHGDADLKVTIDQDPFVMATVEEEDARLNVPDYSPTAVVHLSTSVFQSVVGKFVGVGADQVQFNVTHDTMVLSFESTGMVKTGSKTLVTPGEPDGVVEFCNASKFQQRFTSRYMMMISKAANLSDMVKLVFCDDMPICIQYTTDHIMGKASFAFYLAPVIDP